MPINRLFVEGELDSQVLNPIFAGTPLLQIAGSKNSLKPRARTERNNGSVAAGYLRDRDFDFDPPADVSKPTVDGHDRGVPFGWRWCRHEIENYLIEPAIVSAAMGWPISEIENAIREAAGEIRYYQAARWTVGIARRALPPHYELETRPANLNEIALPSELGVEAAERWALSGIEAHRNRIVAETDPQIVQTSFQELSVRFNGGFINDPAQVLLWFSGKDILAGMRDWLVGKGIANPGEFRAAVRNWIIEHPERTLDLLPEWQELVAVLRG